MKAQEANLLATKAKQEIEIKREDLVKTYINNVYRSISFYSKLGQYKAEVKSPADHLLNDVMKILRENGYKVERNADFTVYGFKSSNVDNLIISWQ